ncbi:hypothetical protein SAMD00023353_10700060 [Rosellinia necatrix]|uniref:Fe2OG dioxygenase domain-containing protein n=1 Tax=Rosellinia necatrix TaxID=77044 RepID=A0A1W2TWU1_ROSNE|nr:hypothetical protein SAMD00023353_10700060 [Rosellinia necatrix]
MPGLIDIPPPVVRGPATKRATRPTNVLPRWLKDEAGLTVPESFDATKHLSPQDPAYRVTMKEIGLEGHGISPYAVSAPFPLFSEDAIKQIRREVFSEKVMEECQYSSTFNKNMIRGMGRERAPFTYDAWYSPELVAHVSSVAGIDLVPSFDFEVANINISVNNPDATPAPAAEDNDGPLDALSTVAWHYDSFPFVCVVMLSDCTGMVGGETAIKIPNGDIRKVRGPAMGTAVVMQGRYIEHQALKAIGGRERISMVTCFRPKSPLIKDETVLVGVRGISNIDELYTQYTEYRLELLEERLRAKMKEERNRQLAKRSYNVAAMKKFLSDQRAFLDSMITEIQDLDKN